uniref:Uncharacterized protein n=1 Tax=Rhizophora mucronata TaxID=61149 RepID=A0A2P2PRB3_RHIMU
MWNFLLAVKTYAFRELMKSQFCN